MSFVESVARTNKLHCTDCGDPIKKGDDVVFELNSRRKMKKVFCTDCKDNYMIEVYNDSVHPFSDEAF